jgi:hypothetical protein
VQSVIRRSLSSALWFRIWVLRWLHSSALALR